jgi:hypothetical protein
MIIGSVLLCSPVRIMICLIGSVRIDSILIVKLRGDRRFCRRFYCLASLHQRHARSYLSVVLYLLDIVTSHCIKCCTDSSPRVDVLIDTIEVSEFGIL